MATCPYILITDHILVGAGTRSGYGSKREIVIMITGNCDLPTLTVGACLIWDKTQLTERRERKNGSHGRDTTLYCHSMNISP